MAKVDTRYGHKTLRLGGWPERAYLLIVFLILSLKEGREDRRPNCHHICPCVLWQIVPPHLTEEITLRQNQYKHCNEC